MGADGADQRGEAPAGSPVKRFFTSLPGVMTGLATVLTAGATIVGVLFHSGSSGAAAPTPTSTGSAPASVPASAPASAPPATATATEAAPDPSVSDGMRLLWGPGALQVTNDGTDISDVPPRSAKGLDLYDDGSGFGPMSGTQLAVWHGAAAPTARQCLDYVGTQSSGADVQTPPGTTVCALTSGGELAVIHVLSLDANGFAAETQTSIWAKV